MVNNRASGKGILGSTPNNFEIRNYFIFHLITVMVLLISKIIVSFDGFYYQIFAIVIQAMPPLSSSYCFSFRIKFIFESIVAFIFLG